MENRKYIRKVEAALSCSKDTKKGLIKIVKNDLDAFLLEYPDATEKDMISKFGTPDELAESYLDSLDSPEINVEIKKAKKRKRIVVICCCVIIGITLIFAISILINVANNQPKYVVEVVEEGETVYTHND